MRPEYREKAEKLLSRFERYKVAIDALGNSSEKNKISFVEYLSLLNSLLKDEDKDL